MRPIRCRLAGTALAARFAVLDMCVSVLRREFVAVLAESPGSPGEIALPDLLGEPTAADVFAGAHGFQVLWVNA